MSESDDRNECAICNEKYEDTGDRCPHVLYCGHTFCYRDIATLISLANGCRACCPTCRKTIHFDHYPDKFPPKNFGLLQSLSRENKKNEKPISYCNECCTEVATQYCIDCKFDFCNQCGESVHQYNTLKSHVRCPINQKCEIHEYCPTHDEKLKLFCKELSCNIPVCVLCVSHGDHKSHETKIMDEVIKAEQKGLKEQHSQMNIQLVKLHSLNTNLVNFESKLLEDQLKSTTDIQAVFTELREAIDDKEILILRALKDHVDNCKSEVGTKLITTAETIATSKAVSQEIIKGLDTVGLVFLKNVNEYKKLLEESNNKITNLLTTMEIPVDLGYRLSCSMLPKISQIKINFIDKYSQCFGNGSDGDLEVTTSILLDSEKVYQYENITIFSGGEISVAAWDGQKGGTLNLRVSNQLIIMEGGRINLNGKGYRGGKGSPIDKNKRKRLDEPIPGIGQQGESTTGLGVYSPANNGGGGGGGVGESRNGLVTEKIYYGYGGAGGGYGSVGMVSSQRVFHGKPVPTGGAVFGVEKSAKSSLFMGSGGGGGVYINNNSRGELNQLIPNSQVRNDDYSGGAGGGAILIHARHMECYGSVTCNGGSGKLSNIYDVNGEKSSKGTGGGGGSGGTIALFILDISYLRGTVSAIGGPGGGSLIPQGQREGHTSISGGAGGNGRIRIGYIKGNAIGLDHILPHPFLLRTLGRV